MEKTEVVKNIHGKIEDWHRDLNNGVAPTPWEADSNGNITDALGRPLFTPNLVSVSQGFVGSNIDNAVLICDLVNNFGEYDQSYNLQRLQKIAVDWADGEFPNRVPAMALLKMFGEIGEVIDKPSDAMEWADVLILFLDVAKLCGISGDDLTVAFIKKMEINKKRIWNENELGVISHVTPEEQKNDGFLDAPFTPDIRYEGKIFDGIIIDDCTVSGDIVMGDTIK